MVTERYRRECPIDGCPYKNHVEGKFASLDDVLKHVTAEHKEDHMIPKTAWNVTCEMKGCMEKFKDKSLLSLFRTFIEHNKQAHGTWIDPETCEVCAKRRIDEIRRDIKPNPKFPSTMLPKPLTPETADIDNMTDEEYRDFLKYWCCQLPQGTVGEKMIAERKVPLNKLRWTEIN